MMTTKCEHKTSDTLASWAIPKLSIDACTWGCGEILVSVRDDNGVSHTCTVAELAALRERAAALEHELTIIVQQVRWYEKTEGIDSDTAVALLGKVAAIVGGE